MVPALSYTPVRAMVQDSEGVALSSVVNSKPMHVLSAEHILSHCMRPSPMEGSMVIALLAT
jgi:hypothetical protein